MVRDISGVRKTKHTHTSKKHIHKNKYGNMKRRTITLKSKIILIITKQQTHNNKNKTELAKLCLVVTDEKGSTILNM